MRENFLLWLPSQTKSIIYAAGWRLLKCVLHLYLLLYWWSRRGFKPFLLIFSYSFILLLKTGIYRTSGTAKRFLMDKVTSVFKPWWKSHDFPQMYKVFRKTMFSRFLLLFCFCDCARKSRSSPLRFMLSGWWSWLLFLTNGICMASQYCSRHEYYSRKLCICEWHLDPF